MFFKKKENYIEVKYNDSFDVEDIKIKKNNLDFNITIKATIEHKMIYGDIFPTRFVWFVYVYNEKIRRYRLLAFSSIKYDKLEKCKEDALKYFNEVDVAF